MDSEKEITVIISEDDPGHAELIREALEDSGIQNEILHFPDGQVTWEYLQEQSNKDPENNKHALLVLLDINMPRMNGVEVLRNIKEHAKLKSIPVIMLTTTDDPREIEQCYELGCNVYITKPVDYDRFSDTLKRLGLFMQIIKL
ncbi:MAG: response regulator [Bacteroidales bacterium]